MLDIYLLKRETYIYICIICSKFSLQDATSIWKLRYQRPSNCVLWGMNNFELYIQKQRENQVDEFKYFTKNGLVSFKSYYFCRK